MQRKTVLICDLDGTLWGSSAKAIAVMLDELDKLGVVTEPALETDLRIQWGMHFAPLRDRYFPQIGDEEMYALYERTDQRIVNAPYDGAIDALRFLKDRGIDIYGLTSRGRVGAMSRLTKFGMVECFKRLVCSSDIGWVNAKPSAYGLNWILEPLEKALGLGRKDVVYVGDTVIADRLCAENAGVEFIAMDAEKIVDRVVWLDAGVSEENILSSPSYLPHWLGIE